jgi:hypothetical protein
MKYFIFLGTLLFCSTLTANTVVVTYTYEEVLEIAKDAFRVGWDKGLRKKIEGCTLRSM